MDDEKKPVESATAYELIRMAQVDTDMRNDAMAGSQWDPEVDRENTRRLKGIIEKAGWPTIPAVGKDAASAAWQIAQHADHDGAFQQECLRLMNALTDGEVDTGERAYLEDRVRVNTGRPQLYGTQFTGEADSFEPAPIEEPDRLDRRRSAVGLGPFAEYEKEMRDIDAAAVHYEGRP